MWRIDGEHGNSLAAWEAMGSPAVPSDAQLARLMARPSQIPFSRLGSARRAHLTPRVNPGSRYRCCKSA